MYTSEFWNKVYQEHRYDAPWLTDIWADFVINEFQNYIDMSKPQKILDYGCGNGKIGMHFMTPDIDVEFADISNEQIDKLYAQFQGKVLTYAVSYPEEISNKYDCIICSGVFHHINSKEWKNFLNQFYHILNPKGKLLISGFCETDAILRGRDSRAPMTGEKNWCIDGLVNFVNPEQFKIIDTYKKQIKLEMFEQLRTTLFIILEKK